VPKQSTSAFIITTVTTIVLLACRLTSTPVPDPTPTFHPNPVNVVADDPENLPDCYMIDNFTYILENSTSLPE